MFVKSVKTLLRKTLNFILPPSCLSCKMLVVSYGFCADCFKNIKTISDPKCISCGYPFPNRAGGKKCGACLKTQPPLTIRSAVAYDEYSKAIILYLKHADGHEVARYMASSMLRVIEGIADDLDYIIPIPLHKKRLLKRRFNQSADIARYMAKGLSKPVLHDTLIRVKNTDSQGGKNFKNRQKNLKKAFTVLDNIDLTGKTVLLVDDVYTSGATMYECARVLKKSGVKNIIGVTYGRVLKTKTI